MVLVAGVEELLLLRARLEEVELPVRHGSFEALIEFPEQRSVVAGEKIAPCCRAGGEKIAIARGDGVGSTLLESGPRVPDAFSVAVLGNVLAASRTLGRGIALWTAAPAG